MLKITYTNGDTQSINVTGDFFAITLAPKNGKPVKISPIEKAEDLAYDLAIARSLKAPGSQANPDVLVSSIELLYPGGDDSNPADIEKKVKVIRPLDDIPIYEPTEQAKSFIKGLKEMKREHKHCVPTNKKGYKTRWTWEF